MRVTLVFQKTIQSAISASIRAGGGDTPGEIHRIIDASRIKISVAPNYIDHETANQRKGGWELVDSYATTKHEED